MRRVAIVDWTGRVRVCSATMRGPQAGTAAATRSLPRGKLASRSRSSETSAAENSRASRVRVWQENFPYGMIFVQNPQAHGYVDMKPVPPEPVIAPRKKPVPPKRKGKQTTLTSEVPHVQN